MKNEENLRYGMLDILRLVLCILVVTIHTEPFKYINKNIYISDSLGIARVAVPFFFITTGYFLYNRLINENEPKKTIKRFCDIYIKWIIFEVIVLAIGIVPMILQDPFNMIHKILFLGVTGSLWYVFAMILGLIFSYWFLKNDKIIQLFIVGILLYLFGSSADTYTALFSGTFLSKLTDLYTDIFCGPNMGITVSVLFISIGALINKYNLNTKIKYSGILSILSIILILIEAFTLITLNIPNDYNMYLSVVLATFLIFIWALNSKVKISKNASSICKDYSLGIYCSHQTLMMLLFFTLGPIMQNKLICFILTLGFSILFVAIIRHFEFTKKLLK